MTASNPATATVAMRRPAERLRHRGPPSASEALCAISAERNGVAGTRKRNECIQSPRTATEKTTAHATGARSTRSVARNAAASAASASR